MRELNNLLVTMLLTSMLTAGCGGAPGDKVDTTASGTDAATEQTAATSETPQAGETTAEAPKEAEFIEIEEYRFKLSPDINDSGEAHLDFYVHDKEDKHVKGVTGTFHITKPDGSKEDLTIEEEAPHDHYHGKTVLKDPGEYGVVAQVEIGDKKMNPRFNFKREAKDK